MSAPCLSRVGILLLLCAGAVTGQQSRELRMRRTNLCVERGLGWLGAHQDEDGRWSAAAFIQHDPADAPLCDGLGQPDQDVYVTALAGLAFAGEPFGDATDHAERAIRATRWLLAQQGEDGWIGAHADSRAVTAHAAATTLISLLANRGRKDIANTERKSLRGATERAIAALVRVRRRDGSWSRARYPRDETEPDGDPEATFWSLMALTNATSADLPAAEAWRQEELPHWLTRASSRQRDAAPATTALATVLLIARKRTDPFLVEACAAIRAKPPRWPEAKDDDVDLLEWYTGAQTLFRVSMELDERWFGNLVEHSTRQQSRAGAAAGSWDPAGRNGPLGGRVASTAIQILALQTYRNQFTLRAR